MAYHEVLQKLIEADFPDLQITPSKKSSNIYGMDNLNSSSNKENLTGTPSIEELRKKYLGSNTEKASSDDIPQDNVDDDQYDVGSVNLKAEVNNEDPLGKRIIIGSQNKGIIGFQG